MNGYLVVDASLAYKLIVPDPYQAYYEELWSGWKQGQREFLAPTLWAYELASALSKMAHFGHLTAGQAQQGIAAAFGLGVQLVPPDADLAAQALRWSRRLQRAAAYDSFYLALAERLGCELWTADKGLAHAANVPWLRLVQPS